MTDGLRTERLALPLMEAAVRLGISAEALRLRLERGEVRGFERDGMSFVYVNDPAAERRFGGAADDLPPGLPQDRADGIPPDGTLPVVVEFQKLELTRLLRENERLNTRLDQLFEETRRLRDMQQREQVLRQQEQTLRRQIQETLDRLTSRPALPAPDDTLPEGTREPAVAPPPEPPKARPALLLTRTMAAKNFSKSSNRNREDATRRPGPAFLATGRVARKVVGSDRREPHAVMPRPVPGKPAARDFTAAPAPAPESSAAEDAAIRPEEAAALAEILNGIGRSLRDSEAFRRYPPIKPESAPQRAGDRRPASSRPGHAPGRAPSEATTPVREKRGVAESLSAPKSLSEEESALHAILDSMGPTAEDRRNAARDLGRLLRKGLPSQAGEL